MFCFTVPLGQLGRLYSIVRLHLSDCAPDKMLLAAWVLCVMVPLGQMGRLYSAVRLLNLPARSMASGKKPKVLQNHAWGLMPGGSHQCPVSIEASDEMLP